MKLLKLLVLLALSITILLGETKELPVLVNAQWLNKNIDQVKILDIRSSQSQEYIINSLKSPYRNWRSTIPDNPGAVPPLDVLKENVESLGLEKKDPIVIVFEGINSTDFGSAARVYWTLKYIGFKQLSILNGGFNAYKQLNNPKLANSPITPKRSSFSIETTENIIVDEEGIDESINQTGDKALLLDARNDQQYTGKAKHPLAKRYGAIKDSSQLWQGDWFEGDTAYLQDYDKLLAIAEKYQLPKDKQALIYTYCNTGHWAASNWFVLSEILGYKNAKLFPDSFVRYSQRPGVELKNEPSRAALLWKEVKGWF